MNKTFRIVWSHARHCFVVADEHARGRSKRSAGALLLTGLGLTLLAGQVQAARASCDSVNYIIDSAETVACLMLNGSPQQVTITENGSITDSVALEAYDNSYELISNAGTLTSTDVGSAGILLNSVEGVTRFSQINNLTTGTIQGARNGIQTSTTSTWAGHTTIVDTLNNAGLIKGGDNGLFIDGRSTITRLVNSGTIEGGTHAIQVTSDATITNIEINGTSARFIGDVQATNSVMTIASGADFTQEFRTSVQQLNIENAATFRLNTGTSNVGINPGLYVSQGVNNNGSLSLAANMLGTIHGDYTQSQNGVLEIAVSDDNTYGKLLVNGTANLASQSRINVDVSNPNYQFNTQKLAGVLSATTLNSDGTFTVSDNSLLFDFGAVRNGNAIDLTLAKTSSLLDSVRNAGNTPAFAAAAALERAIDENPNSTLAAPFVGLTDEQQVSDAVTQTLPTVIGQSTQASFDALRGINRMIETRQNGARGMSSGDILGTNGEVWVKTFGSWADQNKRKSIAGYSADSKGLAIGADTDLNEDTRVGIALAYANTQIDSDSHIARQNARIDTVQIIGYGRYALTDNTEVNVQFDVGQNRNKTKRNLDFAGTTASANFDGYSAHAGASISHRINLAEQLTFEASSGADYTWLKSDSYDEKGAHALGLSIDSHKAEQLIVSLDGKLNYQLAPKTLISANLGVGYDLLDQNTAITSAYAGAPNIAFKTPSLDVKPWLARAGLGLTQTLNNGTDISLRYDVETRSGLINQGASLQARWMF